MATSRKNYLGAAAQTYDAQVTTQVKKTRQVNVGGESKITGGAEYTNFLNKYGVDEQVPTRGGMVTQKTLKDGTFDNGAGTRYNVRTTGSLRDGTLQTNLYKQSYTNQDYYEPQTSTEKRVYTPLGGVPKRRNRAGLKRATVLG